MRDLIEIAVLILMSGQLLEMYLASGLLNVGLGQKNPSDMGYFLPPRLLQKETEEQIVIHNLFT